MEGLYVMCVVLTLRSDSVCWTEPSDKACYQALADWVDGARQWAKTSPEHDSAPLAGCMTWEYFREMDKPLFEIEKQISKPRSVENVK